MPLLLALVILALPVPALANAAASAGESATFVVRAIGIAIQLVGFVVIASSLWRIALPPADGDRRIASLLALVMIGAVMVGAPESMGSGMFGRGSATVPTTALPVDAVPSSPIGTEIDPSDPTVVNDTSLWDALNAPIGGHRAEGVARISLLQVLLTLVGAVALLLLAVAMRSQAGGDEDDAAEVRRSRAGKLARDGARKRASGRSPGIGGGHGDGGGGLLALLYGLRNALARWWDLLKDAGVEVRIRLKAFLSRIGLVARTEGGGAVVSMVVAEMRAGRDDLLSRVEHCVEQASEKSLGRGGGTALSNVNAGWILRSHGIKAASSAATGELVGRIEHLLEGRLPQEDVGRRLLHVLDRVDLGATEIWIEHVGGRWFMASHDDVASGIADCRKIDAGRVDWITSAACWTLRPMERFEVRSRPAAAEDDAADEEGTDVSAPSTLHRIRSMVQGVQQRFAQ